MANPTGNVCPLDTYLDKYGISVVAFCDEAEIAKRTIYDLLNGVRKNYTLETLQKIEGTTGGEVTIRKIVDWIGRMAPRRVYRRDPAKPYRPHRTASA